jgi:hypothetical protein
MNDVSELIHFIQASKEEEINCENEIRKLISVNSKNLTQKNQKIFEVA